MVAETILVNLISNIQYFNTVYEKVFKYKNVFEVKEDQFIIKLLEQHYNKYSKILNFDDILIKVENNKKLSQENYDDIKKRVQTLRDFKIDVSLDNLKIETKKFIQDILTEKFIFKCSDFLIGSDQKISHDDLLLEMEDISSISFENDIGYFANTDKLFSNFFVNRIPFFFRPFDELTHGGIAAKTLNLIYGAAGAGKTQLMIHCAGCMAINGKKVLYVSSELAEEMLKPRLDSWFFEVPAWKINPKYMKEDQYKDYLKNLDEYMSNIHFVCYPPETNNMNDIKSYYERLIKDYGFKPDVIIIDSINQMASIRKNIPLGQPHIKQKYTFTEARALAFALNIPILSPTHLSDDGEVKVEEGADVSSSHVGEAKMIKAIADFIVGFKSLYIDNSGIIYKDKAREKCIHEDYEMFKNDKFEKLGKLNIIKSRYGTRVGDSRIIGSNIDYSKFYDFLECYDNHKKNIPIEAPIAKKENNINKQKQNNINNNTNANSNDIFANRKKRKI